MHLERVIAALAPADVLRRAPVEIGDLAYDARAVGPGALFFCLFAFTFGLLAPFFTRLLLATPPAFIATLAGLAMLRILQNAFSVSFGGGYTLGALVCFLVTAADVPIMRIGAPFWGLVLGLATSWLLERE